MSERALTLEPTAKETATMQTDADSSSADATTNIATMRPTMLFASDAFDSSRQHGQHQQQSPTTSDIAGAAATAAAAGIAVASATSPNSSISSSSTATSPSFLPEMPQWKKDLIQRRKSNVARTIGATATVMATTTTITTLSNAGHAVIAVDADGLQTPTKDFSLKSTNIYRPHSPHTHTQSHHHHHNHNHQQQTQHAHNTVTKVGKHATSQQQKQNVATAEEQQQQSPQLQKALKSILIKTPATENSTIKRISPTTTPTTPTPTATAAAAAAAHNNKIEDKSEQYIGGHYTPLAQTTNTDGSNATATAETKEGNDSMDRVLKDFSSVLEQQLQQQQQKSLTASSPIKMYDGIAPIPAQRSFFLASPTTPTSNTTTIKNHTKEQKQQQQHQHQQQESATSNCAAITSPSAPLESNKIAQTQIREETNGTTTTTTTTRLTSSTTMRERECERESADCVAGVVFDGDGDGGGSGGSVNVHETETTRKSSHRSGTYNLPIQQQNVMHSTITTTTTTTTPTTPTNGANSSESALLPQSTAQHQNQNQSHSKHESVRTSPIATSAITDCEKTVTPIGVVGSSAICGGGSSGVKISTKLQNNQFIKNQQQQHLTSAKYYKYKAHSVQDTNISTNVALSSAPGAAAACGTGSAAATNSTTATNATTTTTKANTTTNKTAVYKKKMVAVQEMKKTTQNASHPHHHTHHGHQQIIGAATCARQQQHETDSPTSVDEFDPSEDLSYGPGIVSKLRYRYLSLALRESMEKQRHCLDNLRRATSLNNLLDRDEHKEHVIEGDDAGEDDEEEADELEIEVQLRNETGVAHKNAAPESVANNKQQRTTGILKTQTHESNSVIGKKTATFQKTAGNANNGTVAATRMTQSQYYGGPRISGGAVTTTSSDTRSRHIKRGNDSLKRARSVEALLCEKSPWNFVQNRSSFDTNSTRQSSNNSPTCVTIEDKINNARDRRLHGTETSPPKRLTSIIDDTERPPPDLVKQTLKMFEATANRRGRPQRTNGKGEVASKVANYKSIIKENKPQILFPKPPSSPTKKQTQKPAAKPIVAAADLLSSPIGRKTAAAVGINDMLITSTPTAAAKQGNKPSALESNSSSPVHKSQTSSAGLSAAAIAEHTAASDMPKPKLLAERVEALLDSPVTALTKKLEKLNIEASNANATATADKQQAKQGNVIAKESQQQQQQKQQQQKKLFAEDKNDDNDNENENDNDAEQFVGGDAAAVAAAKAVVTATTTAFAAAPANTDGDKNSDRVDSDILSQSAGTIVIAAATTNDSISSDLSDDEYGLTKRVTKTALDNIAKAGTTQQFKFGTNNSVASKTSPTNGSGSNQQQNETTNTALHAAPIGKQIGIIRPLLTNKTGNSGNNSSLQQTTTTIATNNSNKEQQQHMETLKLHAAAYTSFTHPTLTSREIEKNRINEMKKTNALADTNATGAGAAVSAAAINAATSLNTVINTNSNAASKATAALTATSASASSSSSTASSSTSSLSSTSGLNELDAAITSGSSPLWALRKTRQHTLTSSSSSSLADNNTTMVFNFSNRKEVPDYIENDGVIFRPKREVPKPNESGYVVLGDLSLETSTDPDYDNCPPSPCDVEFENANIVIDGKSSIRQKSKEATFRVQFNDTLTSTYEYPSEASLIVDDSFTDHHHHLQHHYANNDIVTAYENLILDDTGSPAHQRHHHVAVDEIIPLPMTQQLMSSPAENANAAAALAATVTHTPTKNMLGNLPIGSAPLGFYTPVKAPIVNLFQLGVTRAPNGHAMGNSAAAANGNGNATLNGIVGGGGSGSIVGISDGLIDDNAPESLQYLKPTKDDLTIAYSEGAQKTDLLY